MSKILRQLKQIKNKNKTVTSVAEELGVSRQTIYKWLEAYDKKGAIAFRGEGRKINITTSSDDVVLSEGSTLKNDEVISNFQGESIVDFTPADQAKINEVVTHEEVNIIENVGKDFASDSELVDTLSNFSNSVRVGFSKLKSAPVLLSIFAIAAVSLISTSDIFPKKSETIANVVSYSLLNEPTSAQSNPESKSLLSTLSVKVYCGISYLFTSASEWKCGKNYGANISSDNVLSASTSPEIIKYITQVSTTTVYVNGTTTPVINNITRYIPVPGPKGDTGPQGPKGDVGSMGMTGSSGSSYSPYTSFSGPSPQFTIPQPNYNNQTFLSPTLSSSIFNGVSTFNGLLSATDITANTLTVSATTTLATTTVNGAVTFNSNVIDARGLSGTSGQVLTSTGTSTRWFTLIGGGGGGNVASGTQLFTTLYWDGDNWLENTNFLSDLTSSTSTGGFVVLGDTTLATTTITKGTITNLTITNLTASNTLSSSGNVLTSNIGGSSATSTIITSNTASSSA
ncbi:helix-turn-helix domain-containing protein, partial [Candidatus Gracilibacteria bacterium]|nr:helix-turn-helix domain-containing protein [Candidatus Gracilibacteria bacterium]